MESPDALRDLFTGDQSTQSRELLPESSDLAVARTTSGLGTVLLIAGEPLGTVALIARTGTSDITCRPREAAVPIFALPGRWSAAHAAPPPGGVSNRLTSRPRRRSCSTGTGRGRITCRLFRPPVSPPPEILSSRAVCAGVATSGTSKPLAVTSTSRRSPVRRASFPGE